MKTQEEVLDQLIEWYERDNNYGIYQDTFKGWEELSPKMPHYYLIIEGVGYIIHLTDYLGWFGEDIEIEYFSVEEGYLTTKEEYFSQSWFSLPPLNVKRPYNRKKFADLRVCGHYYTQGK
jgi:hypothetical protein